MNEQTQYTTKGQGVEASLRKKSPAGGRGELILAMLPFLLILLADSLPKLLVISGMTTFEEAGFRILNTGLLIVLTGSLLAVFILAWHRKWPIWSATWVLFFCIPPLVLAVGLANWLVQGQLDFTISQDVVLYFWIPLVIAILLYAVTRLDPLRGLLAALPVIYLLWQPNMEFVPDPIELAIKVLSILLICLTIVFILRRGDWRTGLYVILGVNLAVGALFAYAGIYHGGTLPFDGAWTEPGRGGAQPDPSIPGDQRNSAGAVIRLEVPPAGPLQQPGRDHRLSHGFSRAVSRHHGQPGRSEPDDAGQQAKRCQQRHDPAGPPGVGSLPGGGRLAVPLLDNSPDVL